jgi:lipopolysaccharide export system permease protein
MRKIAWMISRMVLTRCIGIALGIALFVITLEIVSNAREVMAVGQGQLSFVGSYILYRMPQTLATFLPMSVLLALLLTLTELSYRNELVAIWSMGISPARLIIMLLPVATVLGISHFLISDRAVPAAAKTLRLWGIADYGEKKLKVGERDAIWLRNGNDIMRATIASDDSRVLAGLIIFKRNADGELQQQIHAQRAVQRGQRWLLANVVVYGRDNKAPTKSERLVYDGSMRPAAAGTRSGDPEEMTFSDIDYFVRNGGFGVRPVHFYETWWHKRLNPLVVSFVMLVLCVPMAAKFRRGGGLGMLFALGIGFGFTFFVLDGVSLSLGELGLVPPWMGAWTPTLLFSFIAAYLLLRTERI